MFSKHYLHLISSTTSTTRASTCLSLIYLENQLPVINRNGQLTSGVPFSTASSCAPSQSASSSRCITTPGPVVYDISYIKFEHIIDHLDSSSLEDLPPEWLKPHLILCDSGASTSVAPPSFAPHIDMQPFQNDITFENRLQVSLSTSSATRTFISSQRVLSLMLGSTSRMSRDPC